MKVILRIVNPLRSVFTNTLLEPLLYSKSVMCLLMLQKRGHVDCSLCPFKGITLSSTASLLTASEQGVSGIQWGKLPTSIRKSSVDRRLQEILITMGCY